MSSCGVEGALVVELYVVGGDDFGGVVPEVGDDGEEEEVEGDEEDLGPGWEGKQTEYDLVCGEGEDEQDWHDLGESGVGGEAVVVYGDGWAWLGFFHLIIHRN